MLAIILTLPPHSLQVSMSMLKTRFNRFAQFLANPHINHAFFTSPLQGLTLELSAITLSPMLGS
jgi:hypothetical protein